MINLNWMRSTSAICEVMNQMMGASATALSEF
ncbi:MAG: chemotaxis protein CheC [Pilosibacter sp.]